MNDLARRTLPLEDKQPFDKRVLAFHPERSQPKVAFMLDQAAVCPVSNPPPMTMIINIPERVLLIKVSRLSDGQRRPAGYTLAFYDITDLVSSEPPKSAKNNQTRRLKKIPTMSGQRLVLVDSEDLLHLHSDGHYTRVITADDNRFCNLSIGDLEARLDPEQFVRVHRSHIVNLSAIKALVREGGRLVLQLSNGGPSIPVARTAAAELRVHLGMRGDAMRLARKKRTPT
ncbi:LytR/AlgR family response regulator transcription factor [Methylibium sp.]|uniref:LytR/AlgR family response regulator transcription factor n=1 Tax=Methylibium sp. TaxID=2067992 RepID=UPI003D12A4A6